MRLRSLPWALLVAVPLTASEKLPATLPAGSYTPAKIRGDFPLPPDKASALRDQALARAAVWRQPAIPIPSVDLLNNPPGEGSFERTAELACKFLPKTVTGKSPKFQCVLPDGRVLRVKYGPNPEVRTEIAATRLLEALGFGADRVYAVNRVRCFGCPKDPFELLSCISSPLAGVKQVCVDRYGTLKTDGKIELKIDYTQYSDFDEASVEQLLEGQMIAVGEKEGWSWSELDKIDPSRGADARAERDALRLMAVLLNHWDNRPDNQRLVCLQGEASTTTNGVCPAPFAFIHDLGGTFGKVGGEKAERKRDLEGWRSVAIWKDPAKCVVEIEAPRLHGATFGKVRISEAGRRHLAGLLTQLSEEQVRGLFLGARFPAEDRDWAVAFQEKVKQIAERPPCPSIS
jgi:hypothetical protein